MDNEKFSDRGYRKLFSHPRMVEDLLRFFVREDFVREIDFTTLARRNESYVSRDFRKRESDIVWQVKARGRDAYIYLLIEFQSTDDHWMALRLLNYILLFCLDLIKEKKLVHLPAVFPVVLYNGDAPWKAPENLEELIDVPFPSLTRYIPRFHYYKIAENEFSVESLAELQSLVSALFRIENSDVETLAEAVASIARIYQKEASDELRRDFVLWLRRMLSRKGLGTDLHTLDETEVRQMLLTSIDKFEAEARRKGREEGRDEGRAEGRDEGRAEGQRSSAKALLEWKFGQEGLVLHPLVDAEKSSDRLNQLIRLVAEGRDLRSIRAELWPEQPG